MGVIGDRAGVPFDTPPLFAPIDETIEPRPEWSYALSKVLGEEMARQFNRRTGIPFVGLRISNIMEPDDYAAFPSYWDDAQLRRWNLWGYVDCRDVALACRLGLETEVTGAEVCIIAAADTVMPRPSADLMAEVFPEVPLTRPVSGRETLLSIDRARRVLGTSRLIAGRTTSLRPEPLRAETSSTRRLPMEPPSERSASPQRPRTWHDPYMTRPSDKLA